MKRGASVRVYPAAQRKRVRMLGPRYIPRSIRQETKYVNITETGGNAITSSGYEIVCGDIDQGTGPNERSGRKVTPLNVSIKYFINAQSTATPFLFFRAVLFRAIGKYSGTPTDYVPAYNQPAVIDKCNVLWDLMRPINTNTLVGATPTYTAMPIAINKRVKLNRNKLIQFSGATGETDDTEGQIVLVLYTNNTAGTGGLAYGHIRLFFKDP